MKEIFEKHGLNYEESKNKEFFDNVILEEYEKNLLSRLRKEFLEFFIKTEIILNKDELIESSKIEAFALKEGEEVMLDNKVIFVYHNATQMCNMQLSSMINKKMRQVSKDNPEIKDYAILFAMLLDEIIIDIAGYNLFLNSISKCFLKIEADTIEEGKLRKVYHTVPLTEKSLKENAYLSKDILMIGITSILSVFRKPAGR